MNIGTECQWIKILFMSGENLACVCEDIQGNILKPAIETSMAFIF